MSPQPGDRVGARRLAMDLLARREHSRLELARKMSARGFGRELLSEVLDELREEGLQSDQRFAESFVISRVEKGKGPLRILSELRERGVEECQAQEALEGAGADWPALARAALDKRFGAGKAGDLREQARRSRFLAQRGFSAEQARRVLGDISGDWPPTTESK